MASPRGSQKADTKLREMLTECLPELPAFANMVFVVAPCRCAASATCCTSGFESNSHGQQHERKNVNQHINDLQLLNTTWFTPSGHKMSQFKKNDPCGIKRRPSTSKPRVCAVHRPCSRNAQKRAGMSGSGSSRATQHGWSSLAGSGASSWVAKNAGSHLLKCGCSGRTEGLAEFSTSASCRSKCFDGQSSQRAASRFYRFLGTRLRTGIWEECLHSI